jgi:hypothetical protein
MNNLFKSILIIIFLSLLQLSNYNFYLKPIITTWGASENEISMPMAGDDNNLIITSTRAILINAPQAEVWKWLIQLGADRGGTFLLIKVNNQQTRLVIRSQESKAANQWVKIANYIGVPLHFIMERQTLMGIKERAETYV